MLWGVGVTWLGGCGRGIRWSDMPCRDAEHVWLDGVVGRGMRWSDTPCRDVRRGRAAEGLSTINTSSATEARRERATDPLQHGLVQTNMHSLARTIGQSARPDRWRVGQTAIRSVSEPG